MPYKDSEKAKINARKRVKCYQEKHPIWARANNLITAYRQIDKRKERGECTITEDWIMENIFTSKCHYCDTTGWENLGCDRINNDLPHTPENIVPCCTKCNKKRGNIPFEEFIKRMKEGETMLAKNRPDLSKTVVAKNDEGEVVYEFASTAEAGRRGYNAPSISTACRGCYKREGNHKYKGLNWFFK